jgi:hypothetical protein
MGTAGRAAPLRRTGSLLGLLGLEVAAVVGLHLLGRFEGLRIGWAEPVPWLLSSPVQDILGALLRTVGLVMAYWLLASTLLYLLASLTRLPAAVRAVGWATLPLVRRVADHAVAVTLATSMVGGGTLGVASPAMAADRGRAGPPARKPVAALTAAQDDTTTTAAYSPKVAGAPDDADRATGPSGGGSTSSETTPTTAPPTTAPPATAPPTTAPPTTAPPTTAPPTTAPPTTAPPTTAPPTTKPTTTRPPTTTQPPAYVPAPASRPSKQPPTTTATAPTTTTAPASSTTTTTGLRPPAYRFPAAGTSPAPKSKPPPSSGGAGSGGSTGSRKVPKPGAGEQARPNKPHMVQRGENLWTIARDQLASARSGGSGEPTKREVARYWLRVMAANKHHLWSGDPNLIYPKEPIILPPVD